MSKQESTPKSLREQMLSDERVQSAEEQLQKLRKERAKNPPILNLQDLKVGLPTTWGVEAHDPRGRKIPPAESYEGADLQGLEEFDSRE